MTRSLLLTVHLEDDHRPGQLAGITGDGGLSVDPDGTHRIWLEYQIGR